MTTQTLPYGASKHHTEATLRGRLQEARDIKEAWAYRLNEAHRKLRVANATGFGVSECQGVLRAVQVEFDDAVSMLSMASSDLEAYCGLVSGRRPVAGVRRSHGRGGVIGHG